MASAAFLHFFVESLATKHNRPITKGLSVEQVLVVGLPALGYNVLMENKAESRPVSLAWRLALLLPLVPAVVLQVLAPRQSDLHAEIRFSTIGLIFLFISLIGQSLLLMRTATKWGIALLIFTSAGLGFALHTLLRVL
ncbi:MAG TPA: hypothetical protein VF493_07500 [Terriglobales bacterium]